MILDKKIMKKVIDGQDGILTRGAGARKKYNAK